MKDLVKGPIFIYKQLNFTKLNVDKLTKPTLLLNHFFLYYSSLLFHFFPQASLYQQYRGAM